MFSASVPVDWLVDQLPECGATAKSLQSCPTLCNPIDGSPPGSPVPGSLQARTLEWVVISFSNAWKWKAKVKLLSRVRLSDPMDCSLPGSSIHGIFQARVLEWGAVECGAGRGISQNVHSLTVGTSFVILDNFGVLEMKVTCLFRTIVLTQSTTSHLLWQMN